MKSELWIASGNVDKARELRDFALRFFPTFGLVQAREPRGVVEDQPTFVGNAQLKSHALANELIAEGKKDFVVLSDDSGLCVDLLAGRPGVHSARYSGAEATPQKNVTKLLSDLAALTKDLARRSGQYRCAISWLRIENGTIVEELTAEGLKEGFVALSPAGNQGYAYDVVFLIPPALQSYGEVSYEEKQTDSHRARAFAKLRTLVSEQYR